VSKDDELIVGVPRARIIGKDPWHGIREADIAAALAAIGTAAEVRRRGDAEEDPSWQQIIPYLLLRDGARIFLMRRTRAGGDARLHERWSIGIGGHLNPDDGTPERGLIREFHEEVEAEWDPELRLVGLLNDDSTPVGAVHLGVVYEAQADGRAVAIRETDKLVGEFVEPPAVRDGYEHLETWSQIVFDHVIGNTDQTDDGGQFERGVR
jgi:predicted NUDIX family phosphoesterase